MFSQARLHRHNTAPNVNRRTALLGIAVATTALFLLVGGSPAPAAGKPALQATGPVTAGAADELVAELQFWDKYGVPAPLAEACGIDPDEVTRQPVRTAPQRNASEQPPARDDQGVRRAAQPSDDGPAAAATLERDVPGRVRLPGGDQTPAGCMVDNGVPVTAAVKIPGSSGVRDGDLWISPNYWTHVENGLLSFGAKNTPCSGTNCKRSIQSIMSSTGLIAPDAGYDPHVAYTKFGGTASGGGRWIITTMQGDNGNSGPRITWVMISNSESLTNPSWKVYKVHTPTGGGGDRVQPAVTKDKLILAGNCGVNCTISAMAFSLADLVNGTTNREFKATDAADPNRSAYQTFWFDGGTATDPGQHAALPYRLEWAKLECFSCQDDTAANFVGVDQNTGTFYRWWLDGLPGSLRNSGQIVIGTHPNWGNDVVNPTDGNYQYALPGYNGNPVAYQTLGMASVEHAVKQANTSGRSTLFFSGQMDCPGTNRICAYNDMLDLVANTFVTQTIDAGANGNMFFPIVQPDATGNRHLFFSYANASVTLKAQVIGDTYGIQTIASGAGCASTGTLRLGDYLGAGMDPSTGNGGIVYGTADRDYSCNSGSETAPRNERFMAKVTTAGLTN